MRDYSKSNVYKLICGNGCRIVKSIYEDAKKLKFNQEAYIKFRLMRYKGCGRMMADKIFSDMVYIGIIKKEYKYIFRIKTEDPSLSIGIISKLLSLLCILKNNVYSYEVEEYNSSAKKLSSKKYEENN